MKLFLIFVVVVSIASSCNISGDDIDPGLLVDFQASDGDDIIDTVCLPMRSAEIRGSVVDGIVEVTLTQEFETYVCPSCFWPQLERTQGRYQLPLDEKAAVTAFRFELGDRVIEGIVKDKEEAEKDYNDAVEAGKPAALAEQTRPDIFKISVGNMPPNAVVKVVLVYVSPLEVYDSDTFRFVLPTKIAPRYQPRDANEPSPELLEPLLNNGVTISLGVVSSNVLQILSGTHTLQTRKVTNTVNIVEVVDSNPLERDVVIAFKGRNLPEDPQIFIEESSTGTYAMLMSWVPQISENNPGKNEFIFILDRSGSMQGEKISQLRTAMRTILGELPPDALFNFVGFGFSFEYLFPEGSEGVSNERAFASAISYINSLAANLGGTEILAPVKAVLESEPFPTYQRNIFLITDGQVWNEDEVIEVVRKNVERSSSRVFTLGIGSNVGRTLINGVARVGAGTSDYVDGDSDIAITDAVSRQMAIALNTNTRYIDSVTFENTITIQAPHQSPKFFSGRRILMYFLTERKTPPGDFTIEVRQEHGDADNYTDFTRNYKVASSDFIRTSSIFESEVIHKIGAREMIRDLEEGRSSLHDNNDEPSEEELKEKIIDIGVKYQIVSSETSFIATDNKGWTAVVKDVNNADDDSFDDTAATQTGFVLCFSEKNMVMTRDKGPMSMKNIQIGDLVYVGSGNFSPVYSFGHRDENQLTVYLQLHTSNGRKPLEISHDHMVYVDKYGAIPAKNVQIGDHLFLGERKKVLVTKISTVNRVGAYAPFTKSGTIVASNILASTYIAIPEIYEVLSVIKYWKIFSMQWLSHTYQMPHRIFCSINESACNRDTYTDKGIPNLVYLSLQIAKWISNRGCVMMYVLMIPITLIAVLFHGIEKALDILISLGTFYSLINLVVVGIALIFFLQKIGKIKYTKIKTL